MPNANLVAALGALAGRPMLLDERFLARWLAGAGVGARAQDAQPFASVNGVAVVSISGPLTHHTEATYAPLDSYDAIRERVSAAFESRPRAVVLALDTPGGECSGCFELARDMRAMAARSGIRLIASVDGLTCSAGYALACSASQIYAPATAIVGSVGVITGLMSISRLLDLYGIDFKIIASGKRKADGHPAQPISDEARDATGHIVAGLADIFFAWVAEARPALNVETVRALEAGILLGRDALRVGMIDGVATLDEVIAMAAKAPAVATKPPARAAKVTGPGARGKGTNMRTTKPGAETTAEMESCDLAELRAAMEMPDQPAQEVVDAAAARIREQSSSDEGEGEGAGEGGSESASTKALRAEVATLTAARAQLEEQVRALSAEIAPLRERAVRADEAEMIGRLDAELARRGMPTKGERRDEIVAIAKEHGEPAAMRTIKLAHVPPGGASFAAPPPASARPTTAPEGDGSPDPKAQAALIADEERAIRAAHPNKPAHVAYREAVESARKKRPELFARAS
jgi:ClpP class serine protease